MNNKRVLCEIFGFSARSSKMLRKFFTMNCFKAPLFVSKLPVHFTYTPKLTNFKKQQKRPRSSHFKAIQSSSSNTLTSGLWITDRQAGRQAASCDVTNQSKNRPWIDKKQTFHWYFLDSVTSSTTSNIYRRVSNLWEAKSAYIVVKYYLEKYIFPCRYRKKY